MQALCPTVSWGQRKNAVLLKVHLRDMKDHDVSISNGVLNFSGFGNGASGENTYNFNLNLFNSVTEIPNVTVTPASCQIVLNKKDSEEPWPRLTKEKAKLPWLRVDFDYLETEEGDSESEDADDEADSDLTIKKVDKMTKGPREFKQEATAKLGSHLSMIYLFSYNTFQWLLFMAIFFYLIITVGVERMAEAFYINTGSLFKLAQTMMVLEVVHAAFKLTKSAVIPCVMQICGRGLFIFVIIPNEPRLQSSLIVLGLFFAYCSVEIFRYPYYMLHVLSKEWYPVTWLRYSVWIVLYPLGLVLEIAVAYVFWTHRAETLFEPTVSSMAPFMFIPVLLLMLIADFTMLRHMWRQRSKKMYGASGGYRAVRERRGPPRKPKTT